MTSDPTILIAGWEYVGAIPAHQEGEYSLVAQTLVDSTVTDGIAYSVFFVRAATANPGQFFDSPADSGYSRDNLAPSAPVGFQVSGVTGSDVELSWEENLEADLRYYSVYRGSAPDFVPSVSNRIAQRTQTFFVNVGAAVSPYYYKVSATDFAGNESAFTLTHLEVTDVDPSGELPEIVSFRSVTTNPVRERAILLYDLPSSSVVTLETFDARGRLVRSILNREALQPGRYTWEWDLRDALGVRVGQGVYFHRFTAGNSALTVKTVVIQ